MSGAAGGFARVLLFAFGVLAPVAWGALTYLGLPAEATQAALALTVVGAATGMLLQWAWLSRMQKLAEQLERWLSRESASPGYGQAVYASGAQGPGPSPAFGKPAAATAPASVPTAKPAAAAGKGGGAAHAGGPAPGARGAAGPPPPAAAPTSPAWHEPAASPGNTPERRPEAAPPPFPASPAPSGSGYGLGVWGEPAPPRAEPARGRRLEPAALAAVWNDLLINGNGVFDARSLAAALAAAGVEAEILPPDNFVGLGVHLLVALEPSQRERAFLLPDFTRLPKAFVKWFDLGPAATGPSGRMERLSRPAELKRSGARYELAIRGLIE